MLRIIEKAVQKCQQSKQIVTSVNVYNSAMVNKLGNDSKKKIKFKKREIKQTQYIKALEGMAK